MKDQNYFLLPNRFKAIGLAISAASILTASILAKAGISPTLAQLLLSWFILGLLVFVLSKQKAEDETIARARYVFIMHALICGVIIAIFVPPFLTWLQLPLPFGYQSLAVTILVIYIVEFYWVILKYKNKKQDTD